MDKKFIFVFIEIGKFILWGKFELFTSKRFLKDWQGLGGGGGDGLPFKSERDKLETFEKKP